MHPIVERQLDQLRQSNIVFEMSEPASDGAHVLTVRDVPLPEGWSARSTTVRFVVPGGYPFAAPDCFWADPQLNLASGMPPKASNQQPLPQTGEMGTWFSWHVARWNPNHDTLQSFLRLIEQRLSEAE